MVQYRASCVFYFSVFLCQDVLLVPQSIHVLIFFLELFSGPNSYPLFLSLVSILYLPWNCHKMCQNLLSLRFLSLDLLRNCPVKLYGETHSQSNPIYLIFSINQASSLHYCISLLVLSQNIVSHCGVLNFSWSRIMTKKRDQEQITVWELWQIVLLFCTLLVREFYFF